MYEHAKDKTVLCQISLDVPIAEGIVQDDARLRASIPTITALLKQGCRIVLFGHVGRPNGWDDSKSTMPCSKRLSELLERDVVHICGVTGDGVEKEVLEVSKPGICMLENIRFDERQLAGDEAFGKELAALGEYYVNDDYPDAHRKTAANVVLPTLLPSEMGVALEKEFDAVTKAVEDPEEPLTLIIGGAKADKIGAINNMLGVADHIIVGGVLANTFLKAAGVDVKASKVDEVSLEIAGEFLRDVEEKFLLPIDCVAAASFAEDAEHVICSVQEIPEGYMILDVGPETLKKYTEIISQSKTCIWGGPIGVFEWEAFANGTRKVAEAMANADAYTLVGGGDSGSAIHKLGLAEKMSHVSIGGGATLKLIGGEELAAISALLDE